MNDEKLEELLRGAGKCKQYPSYNIIETTKKQISKDIKYYYILALLIGISFFTFAFAILYVLSTNSIKIISAFYIICTSITNLSILIIILNTNQLNY
jgi:hypothetical protein